MEEKEIITHVDHTQLKPFATWEDIEKLCEEALKFNTASVCIPPCYVKRVHQKYGRRLNICTVVGFPLGYSVTEAKVEETRKALEDGAEEIDMVINISDVKNGDYDKVTQEIISVKRECLNHVLKVIIETCYLTEKEKIAMCRAVTDAGAEYIKTSTGFSTGGATFADVGLMRSHCGQQVKVKAAGGISSFDDAEQFIRLGADRLGTSRLVKLMENADDAAGE